MNIKTLKLNNDLEWMQHVARRIVTFSFPVGNSARRQAEETMMPQSST
jgi:hypothetical protein